MADLTTLVSPEKLAASFELKKPTERAARTVGKMTKAKAEEMVEAFAFMGASFFPPGKEGHAGVTCKKLAKKHNVPVAKVEQLKKEWDEAYAASLPQVEEGA